MSDFSEIIIGSANTNTDPALEVGNAAAGWTNLFADQAHGATFNGVTPNVLGIANQPTSGAATAPPSGIVFALDSTGNLGVSGAVALGAAPPSSATFASIGGASGFPLPAAGTQPGSLLLRSDSELGPRFFQYQYSPNGDAWLPIPVGLDIYNVMDYGAAGTGGPNTDDTYAQQQAVNAAAAAGGGVIYYPPGTYNTNTTNAQPIAPGPVIIPKTTYGLTLAGAGLASTISTTDDVDSYLVSGACNVTFRDLQFSGQEIKGNSPHVPVSGAAVHFMGEGATYSFEEVTINNGAFGIRVEDTRSTGQMVGCKVKTWFVGAYFAGGAEVHQSNINGGTYGVVMDGSSGVRMIGVALFGALSLAMWNTLGASGVNSFAGFDVEANYGLPASGTNATSGLWPAEGPGASYLVASDTSIELTDCWFQGGTVVGGVSDGATYVPAAVTINGGNFSVAGPNKFPSVAPAPITSNSLDIVRGRQVTVAGGNFGTSNMASGYGIAIHTGVGMASILGNNITSLGGGAAGAISIGPSTGISCQDNFIQPSGAAAWPNSITWPTPTTQPFAVVRNPGFNPTGFFTSISGGGSSPLTTTNTYGVPGSFYISPGTTTVTSIAVLDKQTGSFNPIGITTGAVYAEPGTSIRVAWTGAGTPTVHFVGE